MVVDFIVEFTNVESQGAEEYPSEVYTRMDRLTDRLVERALYFALQKGMKLKACFFLTSLRLAMKQSTKL